MNILFVNYGDFTTNSLNHIAGFASVLNAAGHACIVAVPENPDSIAVIPSPAFQPALYSDLLARPASFPNGKPADIVHAWTPRERVRKFVLEYQRHARARLIVHLEDNEDFLLASRLKLQPEAIAQISESELDDRALPLLSHPRRHRILLHVADGITYITPSLRAFVPAGVPAILLQPGVDFALYHPQDADPLLRTTVGLRPGDKTMVFTGSVTFANEKEVRDLYAAVGLLVDRGIPMKLVRTGITPDDFKLSLPEPVRAFTIDLGFVEKPMLPRLLSLADVLVQPGRPGPFNDYRLPSKLPEYLSAGRPVVLPASNVGLEVRDGLEALVLREGSPEEIAAACRRILETPSLARTLSENGPAFARRHFDLATNGGALAVFYAETLSRPLRPESTAEITEGITEITLALRGIAGGTPGPDTPALAGQLARLVEAIERGDPGRAERNNLRRDIEQDHQRLASTQQHVDELTETIHALRSELNEARLNAAHLQNAQDSLEPRTAQLGRDLSLSLRTRHEATTKVRAMQASFSWRITAPLRLLRRVLVDPWRKAGRLSEAKGSDPRSVFARTTAKSGVVLCYSVDHPQSWSFEPGSRSARGWTFAEDGRKLMAIRARVGGRDTQGTYGLKRLDVLASMPTRPQAEYCGWKVDFEVRPSDTRLDLEVRDEAGKWHRFFHADLVIASGEVPGDPASYDHWIEIFDRKTPLMLRRQAEFAASLPLQPRISILMPVYNTETPWLTRAIESVRAQSYPHWELCIADDASSAQGVRPLIEDFARTEPRIKVVFRSENGHIAAASNSALELATGDFIALLDHDDELAPDALFEVATLINTRPDIDYVYSDEDKIDLAGRRYEPYFKPDFLPDLFHGQNYMSHLSVYRASVLREAGGFRTGFEGSQDWDLALRVIERTIPERIHHIPKVLYHWRAVPGSTALLLGEKDYAVEAARRALADHFSRLGQRVELEPVPGGHWRVKYPLPAEPPLVTLIIPTRNRGAMLQRCVDGILSQTTYPRFEIVVVDNDTDDPATLAYLESLARGDNPLQQKDRHGIRVLRHPGPFNYSALNNRAVEESRGEVIGLLNNDLEVLGPGWLEEMTSHALRPEIGCVGAMLYYPNDTIQHAGIVLGLGGVAGHAFRDFPRGGEGKFNRARLTQNYSAVTAACLLVRREIYREVGGLDEGSLTVAFNDVDFCLKVRAAGYRNVWTPFAEFYHHESATRGQDQTASQANRFCSEIETMQRRWGSELANDPAYNPNLTLELSDFSLGVPRRVGSGAAPRPAPGSARLHRPPTTAAPTAAPSFPPARQ